MTQLTHMRQITGHRIWYKDQWTDRTAYETMGSAKSRLLMNYPFWGMIGIDLVLVEAPASIIPTMATDGYHIFYSAAFVNRLRMGEVVFGVAHEIYHCVLGHTQGVYKLKRKHKDWDSKRWNRACDYVINSDLRKSIVDHQSLSGDVSAKPVEFITTIQILYDPKFDGMSSEEVYWELEKNDPMPDCDTMDVHIEFDTDAGDSPADTDQQGDSSSGGQGNSITVKVSQDYLDTEAVRWEQVATRAIYHATQSGQDAGVIPENLRRLVASLSKPKVHWTTLLRKFVTSVRSVGYSFIKPDKRTFGGEFITPAFRRNAQKLTLAVAIDTSGSIGEDQLRKFLSELVGILNAFPNYEVHIFCFEGNVDPSTYDKLTNSAQSAQEKILSYVQKVTGGGGTCFQSVWDFLREKKIKPRGLIMFTDGYANDTSWYKERGIPTMFVTLQNPTWKAPFGMTIPFETL